MATTDSSALAAARQQLAYWKQQRDIAELQVRPDRLAQCEKFISQCELVISALSGSIRHERPGQTDGEAAP
jgi:hypothetical protein